MSSSDQQPDLDTWVTKAQAMADNIRKRGFAYVMQNNGGYLSQICSSAEIFALLYSKVLNIGASEAPMIPPRFPGVPGHTNPHFFNGSAYNGPKAPDLDRFIFSPAHYALPLYVALIEAGRMAPQGLDDFNKDGGTVELIAAEHSPGVETTTGSLAQALSHAGGIALARRHQSETGRVWVMMTDGEFQEGQTWEAIATLVHYRLDNIAVIVDVNGQQCDGATKDVMGLDPLQEKIRAFGGRAFDVNGHDLRAMNELAQLKPDGRPLFILARTNPTQGVPLLQQRAPILHYLRFSSAQERNSYQRVYEAMLSEGVLSEKVLSEEVLNQ
jgi:transketolase